MRDHAKLALFAFVAASAIAGLLARPRAPDPAPTAEVVAAPASRAPAAATPSPRTAPPGFAPLPDAPPPAALLPPPEARRPTTIDVFYGPLAAFGEWVLIEGYGRCWRPRIAIEVEWHPYAHGHWVATDLGWEWSSDHDWGEWRAAPYHYGRWWLDGRRGWVWAPDVVWAPSWVTWRSCDGWIGWAPTPPVYRWAGRAEEPPLRAEAFLFVPAARFLEPRPFAWHAAPPERAEVFVKSRPVVETVTFDGVVVNAGPPVAKVTVVTGVTVTPVKIVPVIAAGRGEGPGGAPGPGHAGAGGPPGAPPGSAPSGKPAGPVRGGHGGHR